jgi:hypothetical protein
MSYYKDKKAKKQAAKDPSVDALAATIFEDVDETEKSDNESGDKSTPIDIEALAENTDIPDVPDVIEEPKPKGKIPNDTKEDVLSPATRHVFDQGTTKATAVVVKRRIEEIYSFLGFHLGYQNGDYFIGSENTLTSFNSSGQRRRYKCIIVEDKSRFVYTLWFDVSCLGPVY